MTLPLVGTFGMVEYRVFPVGMDGRFIGFELLFCECDAEAVAKAERFADGHDVELWCGPRLVARLEGEKRQALSDP